MTIYFCKYHSPFGIIFLASTNQKLILVGLRSEEIFLKELQKMHPGFKIEENPSKNRTVIDEFDQYFRGQRKQFSIPFYLSGTEFQKKVWDTLLEIPYGQTITYGEIANKIGNPKGVRAVGHANNRNPISIIVPCHRVIGSDGKLVGYGGGLEMKKQLLKLEGALLV